MCLILHQRIVHTLFDSFCNQLLCLERGGVLFLEVSDQCFPLGQFGIAQNCVLDYLIPLVFRLAVAALQSVLAARTKSRWRD